MKKLLIATLMLTTMSFGARAQQWAVSTDVLDIADFGTINATGSVAFARHLVLDVGGKFNPWGYNMDGEDPVFNKQRMVFASVRYFPWFSLDGWYYGIMAGWKEYACGGVVRGLAEEGVAYGGGLGAGYTLLLSKHFNLDIGAYVWAGQRDYTSYSCPVCGRVVDSGSKFFVMPTNVSFSLTWIFETGESKNYQEHEWHRNVYNSHRRRFRNEK